MFSFEYSTTDYQELLEDFARALDVTITDNRIYFPEKVGKGFLQLVQLPAGVQALISSYQINDLFYLKRIKTNHDEFYTLRYDAIMISESLSHCRNKIMKKAVPAEEQFLYNLSLREKMGIGD